MKLLELTLNNWGVFRGKHHFHLDPAHLSNAESPLPLVVISGHNGAGKSTIFQALTLALHGSYALGDRIRQQDYDNFLLSRLHRYNGDTTPIMSEVGGIALSFRYIQSGRPLKIQIARRWHRNTHSIRETLEVLQDGKPPDVEEEDYQIWINDLIPPGLSSLSFFDAEKLDALANPEKHDALLEETLNRLLGLDLVAQLQDDMDYYILHQGGNRKTEYLQKQVLDRQSGLELIENQIEEVQHKIEALESDQADLEANLYQQEALLASEGGTYAARRPDLQQRLQTIKEEIETVSMDLRTLSAGLLPFALAPNLCSALSKRLVEELRIRQRQIAESLLKERINQLQDLLDSDSFWQRLDVSLSLRQVIVQRLSLELEKEKDKSNHSSLIHHLSQPKYEQLEGWISQVLHAVPHQALLLGKRLQDLRSEYDQIQTNLHRVPDDETLTPIYEEILRLENALESAHTTHRSLDEQIGALQYQREEKIRQLQNAAEELRKAQAGERKLELAERSQLVLQAYQDALTRQRLAALEKTLVKTFNTICRKEHLLAKVQIDPSEFHVRLSNADGHTLSLDDLSAGERQLYALSLLWALRRVSGRQLPLVIDTPMARLDEAHRWRLMNEYIPAVSEQVILLTTDTELDENLLNQAHPYLSRIYKLNYDAQKAATQVSQIDPNLLSDYEQTVSVEVNR